MSGNQQNQSELYPKPMEARFERMMTPFAGFIRDQTTGSVLLILCTVIALYVANSSFADAYKVLIETPVGFVFGDWSFKMSVQHWVNDGLMSLFFFVLGLEIKREILVGELRDRQLSVPVIAAALGGMLFPTIIFYMFNANLDTVHGWGIPMATDTAFAVGILALLGRRIPIALITFLIALAIIDDLGAILVIAVFYTKTLDVFWLGFAGLSLIFLFVCNVLGLRRPFVYLVGGFIVWLAMLGSGVHATVAGILVALTVPARPKRAPEWFVRRSRKLVDRFEKIEEHSERPILAEKEQHAVVEKMQDTAEKASTPLRRWERFLEQPVALFVMPIFALVNAGIPIDFKLLSSVWADSLGLGIILGLVLGKVIGITVLTWLAVTFRLGRLSAGVTMNHILGIGLLGGMGFTMSMFIAGLGFAESPETLVAAKTAILLASLVAGLAGYFWLKQIKTVSQ